MPITLSCHCGKSLRIADEHAGRAVKCPICGAIRKPAPEPPARAEPTAATADTFDDFVVIEDTSPIPPPRSPEPAPAPPTPARARLKAAVVIEEPASPTASPAAAKLKKKKRKRKVEGSPEGDDWYERVRANEAWLKRMVRGWAYVIAGSPHQVGNHRVRDLWSGRHWQRRIRTSLRPVPRRRGLIHFSDPRRGGPALVE